MPTLRHALAGRRRMAEGRRGTLALRRRALSSPPSCRFIPALSGNTPPKLRANRTGFHDRGDLPQPARQTLIDPDAATACAITTNPASDAPQTRLILE